MKYVTAFLIIIALWAMPAGVLSQDDEQSGEQGGGKAHQYFLRGFDAEHGQDLAGYTMVYIGTAVDAVTGDTIDFTIKLDEELPYTDCGPNGARGFVPDGGQGMAEMTYHMDHVFGDGDDPASDVNEIALGFGPIDDEYCSAYPCDIVIDQDDLAADLSGDDYFTFINDALRTVGHSGEGHCHLQVY